MKPSSASSTPAGSVIAALALTVAAIVGLAPAGASQAAAVILVANPRFEDPQWRATVLLATPLPHGGHVGVIINRPTRVSLGRLFPEHGPSQKVVDPVYYGGPFLANSLVAVVRSTDTSPPGSLALTSDLVLATGARTIDRVIEQAPASARYFMGMVLWRPGELRAELEKELWSVHRASAETVFRTDMEGLWKELSVPSRVTRTRAPLSAPALAQSFLLPD